MYFKNFSSLPSEQNFLNRPSLKCLKILSFISEWFFPPYCSEFWLSPGNSVLLPSASLNDWLFRCGVCPPCSSSPRPRWFQLPPWKSPRLQLSCHQRGPLTLVTAAIFGPHDHAPHSGWFSPHFNVMLFPATVVICGFNSPRDGP